MRGQRNERFKELCEHAEVEDDARKLAALADEIYELLGLEVEKLKAHPVKSTLDKVSGS